MCLFGLFGDKPKAPDPIQTAQAQNMVNRDALITAAQLNQINQTSPFGSVSYSGQVGSPDRTQTTTLSPELQNIFGSQLQLTQGLSDLANTRLQGAPTSDFSLAGAPDVRRAGGVDYATGFDAGPALERGISADPLIKSFDPGGSVQRNVNLSGAPQVRSDFDNLVQESRNAQYGKATEFLDPQFQQEEQAQRARLAAQGITEDSPAFQREMDNFSRRKGAAYDSARNSAILSGDQLQNQLFGQSLAGRQQSVNEQFGLGDFSNSALAQQFGMNQAQAQFGNQAQAQGFAQNEARARLNNDAAMQDFARNQALASFNNDALARQFTDGLNLQQSDQSLRDQTINEDILARNQNINEAMAFVNGSPIAPQMPTFTPISQSTAAQAAPDATGLAASNYANQANMRSGILGSIFGAAGRLGSAYMGA